MRCEKFVHICMKNALCYSKTEFSSTFKKNFRLQICTILKIWRNFAFFNHVLSIFWYKKLGIPKYFSLVKLWCENYNVSPCNMGPLTTVAPTYQNLYNNKIIKNFSCQLSSSKIWMNVEKSEILINLDPASPSDYHQEIITPLFPS